ncbi:MAG: hypothetical protein IT427_13635, partial [Pirellulales bacterium]|nr:hypothetical protein [Pirellulales bacterium]
MQSLSSPSTVLTTRPFRHLRDLWLVAALFVAVKASPVGGVSKQLTWGFVIFAVLLALVWLAGQLKFVQRFVEGLLGVHLDNSQATIFVHTAEVDGWSRIGCRRWLLVGLVFVAGLLAAMELRQPYYFVQDDNLSQFLPVVLHGCRSMFHDGTFSTWNPHQFLGSPTSSLGTYALTYPPTYLSYAIADWGLGNEYATLDVF